MSTYIDCECPSPNQDQSIQFIVPQGNTLSVCNRGDTKLSRRAPNEGASPEHIVFTLLRLNNIPAKPHLPRLLALLLSQWWLRNKKKNCQIATCQHHLGNSIDIQVTVLLLHKSNTVTQLGHGIEFMQYQYRDLDM